MPNEWYTIQTLSGQEMKAEKSLRKRIVEEEMSDYIQEILLPMEKVVEVRGGKKTTSQRKLYPGYLFIKMKVYDDERFAQRQKLNRFDGDSEFFLEENGKGCADTDKGCNGKGSR